MGQENIKIFNSDGTILTANKIVADQSLNNAIMNDNYIYYPSEDLKFGKNYLRLAAKKVERRNTDWEKWIMEFLRHVKFVLIKKQKRMTHL